ncbi:NAD-dependent epimerase/dehydratase family protein [Aurantiacibacter rhizosphaerae]|uniref:NAD-dependent epimerase/dehydratase family protein n=1 Tax=Aurantiacibacter rhizosphaerae TaxID=2691582 RepID=A0A844XBF9_9SPHN|nr:SDR family oxidoreductase [Aurantiacibacter rhizosphaerae]MWV26974.1 NAD-dependent epimerase/dehydratase family protein [Aurantiacibacter rhizosphaerae]
MKVLITGCCGFIGRYLIDLVSQQGYAPFGLDLNPAAPTGITSDHYFCTSGTAELCAIVEKVQPDLCVHAAGQASVPGSFENPEKDFTGGPALTFAILDALRQFAPKCRLIFLSSASVYGQPGQLPISEAQPLAPMSPYGFHKWQSEILLREFHEIFGLNTACVRIFSAYGIGLRRQVLWDICRRIISEGELILRGTGQESRDFINVHDVASGILTVAQNAPARGEAYNLSSGIETTISELANIAVSALDESVVPAFDGTVSVGDPLNWRADVSAIQALGFKHETNLQDGVAAYALWCKEQIRADHGGGDR